MPAGAGAFLKPYARRRWRLAAMVGAAMLTATAAAVAGQYALKLLIDAMTSGTPAAGRAAGPLVLLLALLLAEALGLRLGGWLGSRLVIGLGADIRADLFSRLLARPWRFFHDHQSGALSGRITAAGQAATAAVSTLVWNVAPPAADLVGSIVVLAAIDLRLAGGLVVAAVTLTTLLHRWGSRGFATHTAYHREAAAVTGELSDVLANIMLVKTYGAARRERQRLAGRLHQEVRLHRRSWMFLERLRLAHDLAFWLVAAVLLAVSIQIWRAGQISAGDVVVVVTLSLRVVNGSRELALALLGFARQLDGVVEAVGTLTEQGPAAPVGAPVGAAGAHVGASGGGASGGGLANGGIVLRDVSYAPGGQRKLLRGFNLDIPSGQMVGIVGPSGAGKSTLVRLIQGLVTPDQGEVRLGGQALADLHEATLADAVALITQEVELLHRSLRDNIAYGAPDADPHALEQAMRAADCWGFCQAIPGGLDAVAGERGVMLSGGQRQRLAVARALLKGGRILLMDEATSALDSATEFAIQAALLQHASGRTVVAVAHRLSTIIGFDRVVVLRAGRIVEDGCPRVLRHAGGPFAEMWAAQSRWSASGADVAA